MSQINRFGEKAKAKEIEVEIGEDENKEEDDNEEKATKKHDVVKETKKMKRNSQSMKALQKNDIEGRYFGVSKTNFSCFINDKFRNWRYLYFQTKAIRKEEWYVRY